MIRSINAARAICQYSNWRTTNLSLHKILYIAHGVFMAEAGEVEHRLIDGVFEAWDYGPVEPDLYHRFKMFGANSIKKYALEVKYSTENPNDHEDEDEYLHIKRIVNAVGNYRSSQLVAITHTKGGAWEQHYFPDESNVIPNSDIYNEYQKYQKS